MTPAIPSATQRPPAFASRFPLAPLAIAALGVALALLPWLLGAGPDARLLVPTPPAATRVVGTGFPKTLTDPNGHAQVLPAAPRRIASAVLASDEMLAALVSVERVVSVTRYVDNTALSSVAGVYPAAVVRNGGGVETLLSARPDLVVVASYSDAANVRLLAQSGVPVLRLPTPDSFAAIRHTLRLLGAVTGAEARAAALVADLDRRLAAVAEHVAGRPRPLVLYYGAGGFTAGPGSLVDEMIRRGGGDNLARVAGLGAHSRISAELAVALRPDVLLVSTWQPGEAPEAALLASNPAWRLVLAVAAGRVYAVQGAWLTSASQAAVTGAEVIADLLHPAGGAAVAPGATR